MGDFGQPTVSGLGAELNAKTLPEEGLGLRRLLETCRRCAFRRRLGRGAPQRGISGGGDTGGASSFGSTVPGGAQRYGTGGGSNFLGRDGNEMSAHVFQGADVRGKDLFHFASGAVEMTEGVTFDATAIIEAHNLVALNEVLDANRDVPGALYVPGAPEVMNCWPGAWTETAEEEEDGITVIQDRRELAVKFDDVLKGEQSKLFRARLHWSKSEAMCGWRDSRRGGATQRRPHKPRELRECKLRVKLLKSCTTLLSMLRSLARPEGQALLPRVSRDSWEKQLHRTICAACRCGSAFPLGLLEEGAEAEVTDAGIEWQIERVLDPFVQLHERSCAAAAGGDCSASSSR